MGLIFFYIFPFKNTCFLICKKISLLLLFSSCYLKKIELRLCHATNCYLRELPKTLTILLFFTFNPFSNVCRNEYDFKEKKA